MEISNIYSDLKKSIRTVSVLGSCALIAACSGDDSQPVGTNSTPSHSLNTYFFQGHTTSSGNELWKSDGTSAGTTLVKEINTLSNSSSANFTEAGNTTFFTANDVIHGNELWKSDANGVSMVKDIHISGSSNPRNLLALNGKLYFIADDATSGSSLWESNGTSDGTIQIGTFTGITNLTPMPDNSIYFTIGNYLWHYNGSALPVSPITPTVSMQSPSRLTAVSNQLYFSAYSVGFGTELWTSNGTDAGTFMVKDIRVGPSDFFGSYNQLFSVNGRLVFTNDSYTYSAFYVSDGTDPGTVQLMTNEATPRAITTYFNTYAIQANSGYVFFTNPDDSYYLWRTDGTPAGTVRLNTAMFSYAYEAQTKADGTYVLQTQNGLMTSDGTASGTAQLIGNASAFAIAGNSIFYP